MRPSDLEDYLKQHVIDRLRLTLASGNQLVIEDTAQTLVGGLMLYIQMYSDPLANGKARSSGFDSQHEQDRANSRRAEWRALSTTTFPLVY